VLRCYCCLEPYVEYPGHAKLCVPCRDEIETQQRRMLERGDFEQGEINMRPWRKYLAAFDAHLRAATWSDVMATREAMTRELTLVYAKKRVWPPEHRPDLVPSAALV
jgi:hypothetical protein